jgi:hypothetical protein
MRVVLTLVAIGSAAAASADEVWLKGGGRLVGDVIEKGKSAVVLDVGAGTVTLPLSRVDRIVSSTVAITEYRERAARLSARDVPGWTALAEWAEQRDLRTLAREAWRRVLTADPENAVAHLALGDVQHQGRWLDFASVQRARGLVDHDGVWMTPAQRSAELQRDADDAAARRQAAIAEIERQEAEARAREAEARARTAEAEAARAEAEADAASAGGIPLDYGGGYGVPVVVQPCGHTHHSAGACPDRGRRRPADPDPPSVGPSPAPPRPAPQPTPVGRTAKAGFVKPPRSNDRSR